MGKTAICNPFALWRRAVTPKYIYKNLKWNMDSMSKCKNSKWGCGTHLYLYIPLLKSNFNTKSFQWLYLSTCLVLFFFLNFCKNEIHKFLRQKTNGKQHLSKGEKHYTFLWGKCMPPTVNSPRSRKALVRPGKTRQSCINAANASKNIGCLNQRPYPMKQTAQDTLMLTQVTSQCL